MRTDRLRQLWDRVRDKPARPLEPPDSYEHAEIAAMLRELGLALVEVMTPTQLVRARVHKAGLAYTTAPVRVVALPTILLIQVGSTAFEVDVTGRSTDQLNIADRVDHITRLAEAGAITPANALQELSRARRMPPRFPAWVRILGYVITTLGFGMIMNPTWASLWGHALLGAVVGVILVAAEQFPSLNAIAPTLAATAVTVRLAVLRCGVFLLGMLVLLGGYGCLSKGNDSLGTRLPGIAVVSSGELRCAES